MATAGTIILSKEQLSSLLLLFASKVFKHHWRKMFRLQYVSS